jgi:catechol 2,3-dioxygenase-like lactoylglutathione lyase family enzyme
MAQTPALDFIVLYISDLDAALSFFTETLGFERVVEGDGPTFRQLKGNGGAEFGLLQAGPETPPVGTVALYAGVSDLRSLHDQLAERGAAVGPVEVRPFGTIFTTPAPDGISLTMWKP